MEATEEYKKAISIQKSVNDALAKLTTQLSSLDGVCFVGVCIVWLQCVLMSRVDNDVVFRLQLI